MRDSVRDAFIEFAEQFEGAVPYFYCDVLGLVTIAYGNLLDPMRLALGLRMLRLDGSAASAAEIAAEWQRVKNDPACAARGHLYARSITALRMPKEDMQSLALDKAESNDVTLRELYPAWDSWPACAQLALHSWAWACGSGAWFPRMSARLRAGDFAGASTEIQMAEWGLGRGGQRVHNAGLAPRNAANRMLLRNAQAVVDGGLDLDTIDWRAELCPSSSATSPTIYAASPGSRK